MTNALTSSLRDVWQRVEPRVQTARACAVERLKAAWNKTIAHEGVKSLAAFAPGAIVGGGLAWLTIPVVAAAPEAAYTTYVVAGGIGALGGQFVDAVTREMPSVERMKAIAAAALTGAAIGLSVAPALHEHFVDLKNQETRRLGAAYPNERTICEKLGYKPGSDFVFDGYLYKCPNAP